MNDLGFKDFLKTVVLETTPEDEKDDTFFGLKDWVDTEFIGIPSGEVQRCVDKNIEIWLESQETARTFVKNLCEIELKQMGIRSAAVAARYAVEKYWKNIGDNRPMAAVELVEKWLKDETDSVSVEELRAAANVAALAGNEAWVAEGYAAGWAGYAAANVVYAAAWAADAAVNSANYAIYAAVTSVSNKEVYDIILEKLPKFNFEDLVRWKYFPGFN